MTLHNLRARFLLDRDDSEAAFFMQERVKDAVSHMVGFCPCPHFFEVFLIGFADYYHAYL